MKIILLQRVLLGYRQPLFEALREQAWQVPQRITNRIENCVEELI